jgi:catechol 2,3-dioxygenase-like lactoylglutathione lyase family enzyme
MKGSDLTGILETVLYCDSSNEDEVRAFYRDVLKLWEPETGASAFRIGEQILLIFNADRTASQDDPPPHGARGPSHVCFRTTRELYDAWKEHLEANGVGTRAERTWPNGIRSFYFDDPAGNVLELADGDLWPS